MKNIIQNDKNSKKILIIGANGFLGRSFFQLRNEKEIIDQNFHFLAADIENTNLGKDIPFYNIDITKSEDISKKIKKISPDVILLTAAMTNVDQNEEKKELAYKINVKGPINVMKACKKMGSKLILMSTDFIFDGVSKNGNYNEEDVPNPQSYYGKTKLEAEQALIGSNIDFLICRTAVLYGWNENKLNFITWVLDKLQKKEKISIVTTQINNATLVNNLVQILLKLIEKDASGIYHTAGEDSLSRYEIALKCAEIFDYNKSLIAPIESFKQNATRPKNAGLDINKLKNLIGSEVKIYNLKEGLNYMKNHFS